MVGLLFYFVFIDFVYVDDKYKSLFNNYSKGRVVFVTKNKLQRLVDQRASVYFK